MCALVSFDTISNLYDAKSIVECYEGDAAAPIPGIKNEDGDWNVKGHPDRVIHVTKKELAVFAKTGAIQVFDVQTVVEQISTPEKVALFALAKDDDLLRLGVPEVQLDLVIPLCNDFIW